MKHAHAISVHDQEASQYDQQVRQHNSYGHDVLFGMSFEYVNPRERILDMGIGTGLASLPFAKAGLKVHGCDGSAEMLKVCEAKAFAKDLKVIDLQNIPLPYADGFFDHVVCCGVLHFFDDMAAIVKEVVRMIKPKGIFTFTVAAPSVDEAAVMDDHRHGYLQSPTPWGIPIFKHSNGYVTQLLRSNAFGILKTQKLLVRRGPEDDHADMLFNAYVAQKTSTA